MSLLAILALVLLDVLKQDRGQHRPRKVRVGEGALLLRSNVVPYIIAYGGVQGLLYAAG